MAKPTRKKADGDTPAKGDEPKAEKQYKRLNRSVGVGEAIVSALDPVMKKRGFASRDIIAQWGAMAPSPFDKVAMPEKLAWPRGERSAEGAVLHLMCEPGYGLAVAHEGPNIARAINRYFGYVLVGQVRLSPIPFSPSSGRKEQVTPALPEADKRRIAMSVADVADPGVREALERLGQGIARRSRSGGQTE